MLSANKASIQPSPYAYLIPNSNIHFRYIGRLLGKALIDNWNLEVSFAKSFLKHILGKPIFIQDLEDLDDSIRQTFQWTLENDITEDCGLTFTQGFQFFGQLHEIELIPDGTNILVTNENKKEYIKALSKAKMTDNIMHQSQALKQGVYDIIPKEALSILNENELGLHLSGMPTMDVDDLEKHVNLDGYQKDDETIKHFFEILREWDDTMKANLLFFYSGTFKIPMGGFKRNPLKLTRINNPDKFPVAHTCFFQIELPDYKDKEKMKDKLEMSVMEGHTGFHIL